jgi:hypothetical protein
MKGPSFRPERTGKSTVLLHYFSAREGVAPYAMALLLSLAKRVWQVKVEMEHYAKKGEEADHDIFLLTLEPKCVCRGGGEWFSTLPLGNVPQFHILTIIPFALLHSQGFW